MHVRLLTTHTTQNTWTRPHIHNTLPHTTLPSRPGQPWLPSCNRTSINSAKGFLSITGLINSKKKKVRKNYSGYGFFKKKKIQNKRPVTVFIFCQMVAQLHTIRRPPLARTVDQRPGSERVDLCPLSTALVPLQPVIHIDQDWKASHLPLFLNSLMPTTAWRHHFAVRGSPDEVYASVSMGIPESRTYIVRLFRAGALLSCASSITWRLPGNVLQKLISSL